MIAEAPYRGTLPHVAGSDTSLEAALSMEGSACTMRARCLEVVSASGRAGRTCDEVEIVTRWTHQTVSARLRELVLMGKIEDTGARRPTRSRRSARVYCATTATIEPSGQALLAF